MTRPRHLRGARIWTADPARPWARSITIADGRVAGIDTEAAVADEIIDLGGGTVTPGLIDGHVHFVMGGLALGELDLSGIRGRADFERAIAVRHEALPAGAWLIARGWTESNWGGATPDKSWLVAAGDRPTVCHRMDLHAALLNDAALAQCTIKRDVEGVRADDQGRPNGLMVEAAAWQIVNPAVPQPNAAMRQAALMRAQKHAHAAGLTAVGTMEYERDLHEVFAPCRDDLTVKCRVTLLDRDWPLDCTPGATFAGDGHLAVIGYKAFLDGTLGSRTARMKTSYADADHCGTWLELAASGHLASWADTVLAAGLSPALHAIGDAAVSLALDLVESVAARDPEAASRIRIEHAQHVDPSDIPRFQGCLTGVQPAHRAEDGRLALARVGPSRVARVFPLRRLHDAGAVLVMGTDWPVVPLDPRDGIRAAVTGLTRDGQCFQPESNLTVEEVFTGYTRDAARGLGLPGGMITSGGPADLTIFDGDPFTVDWATDPGPRVRATVVDGDVVYGSIT